MALCPVCFNTSAYCECEPRFEPSADDRRPSVTRAASTATTESEHRLLREVLPERREALRAIVAGLKDLGAWLETPPAQVRNYVNVRVPSRFGPSRLCAITISTGRIEFQDESYPIVERLGFGGRFDYLAAGEKAAITPGHDDVEIVLAVATEVLASRRGSG